MKITVLGCGSSGGVPLIGNNWGTCDPAHPKNRRLRVSILIEHKGTIVLVDTSPDMRQQMLDAAVSRIDAVLYTHAHADHCHGIDELRSINWLMGKPVDVYADSVTLKDLRDRFPYIFAVTGSDDFSMPSVCPHEINGDFTVGSIAVRPFVQRHGKAFSMGFRFSDFAYSTDVSMLDDTAFDALAGVKTWIVDCVCPDPHPSHAHLELALEWIKRVNPERAFFTHMSHRMDYDALMASLPSGVEPAYDGLVIEC